jgi:diadenosine tetraphosphatase ApaH/serine/threonine PP2A family protein phosphatase
MIPLSRLFSRAPPRPAPFDAPLAPAQRLAVIGDIHGTDGLLERLLRKLDAHAPDRLIFVGDYIDRGEDSAGVVARLRALAGTEAGAVFLKGNHEAMMLAFLDDPVARARRWLRYGGLQTLASYGIGAISEAPNEAQAVTARDALAEAIGPETLDWLRTLPTRFVSGNVAVVHAGADPLRALKDQSDEVLLWGHPAFTRQTRADGLWVVHGHTITARIAREYGRICVDTGAYANGRLSAVVLEAGRFEPVSATWRDP